MLVISIPNNDIILSVLCLTDNNGGKDEMNGEQGNGSKGEMNGEEVDGVSQ